MRARERRVTVTKVTDTILAAGSSGRPDWTALMTHMTELKDLEGILGLVEWEDETYAPPGARTARGPQVATLEAIRHRKLVDPELSDLIDRVEATTPDERVLLERMRREVDRATKVPERLVKAIAEARSRALVGWQQAREAKAFDQFRPNLEELLPLMRERAAALGGDGVSPYDALLDEYEPQMTTAVLRPVLEQLRDRLIPLVEAIRAAPAVSNACLQQPFADEPQWRLTLELLKDLGFDFTHGRQDRSAHPFTSSVNERDVRVTTRIDEHNLMSGISSTIHECGHALYEQGFAPEHHRTYLAAAPSMGIHESQSRLWENQVGLSRPFWTHYFPKLQARFPQQLGSVDLDTFWRAINRVEPSLIRVDADEVTYNLHIVLRFELESAMIAGDLQVADLPGAWNDGMKRLLGVTPSHDGEGCLQDIHWASGAFGYFPTYSIGNLYAAQLFDAFRGATADADERIEQGDYRPLLEWLRTHVHRRGHTAPAQTIVTDAVGQPLSVEPFIEYIETKYRAVYKMSS